MNCQFLIRRVITACVLTTLIATSSMFALAAPGRTVAELNVSGKVLNGEAPVVFVNGEASKSGRSVFSSSTISTPDETTAILSIGKTGRIELEPNSTLSLVFDEDLVDAELSVGTLTVLGSLGTVNVRTNDGKTTTLNPGESITASGSANARRQTGASDTWWIWILLAGGAAAAVVIATSQSNNNDPVVSPNR